MMNNVTNVTIMSPPGGDDYNPVVERVSGKSAPKRHGYRYFSFFCDSKESALREVVTIFSLPVNHAGYNRHHLVVTLW